MENESQKDSRKSIFPDGLFSKYFDLTSAYERSGGNLSNVASAKNVAIAKLVPDSAVVSRLLQREIFWSYFYIVAVLASIGLCFIKSWWFVIGIVLFVQMYRNALVSISTFRLAIATDLLCIEVLAHDIDGWGTRNPNERAALFDALGVAHGEFTSTEWLDTVVPGHIKAGVTH